jgi:hypothetical protein
LTRWTRAGCLAVKSAEFFSVLVDVSANIVATCGVNPASVLAKVSKAAQGIGRSVAGIKRQDRNTCLKLCGALRSPISAKSSETARVPDVPFFFVPGGC